MEFLRYPHLIPTLFNGCGFGPPLPFTATSAWTWVGHPVSGLLLLTKRPIKTWFPFGSKPLVLNLASKRNSPDRSTKSTRLHLYVACSYAFDNAIACRLISAHSQTFGLAHVADLLKLSSILLASFISVLRTRPDRLQTVVCPSTKYVAPSNVHSTSTACKHRVSGSLSLPSRGSFHRSFTVLCAIGH